MGCLNPIGPKNQMCLSLVFPLPFSSQVPQKKIKMALLSIAASHSGISAQLTPGGLQAGDISRCNVGTPVSLLLKTFKAKSYSKAVLSLKGHCQKYHLNTGIYHLWEKLPFDFLYHNGLVVFREHRFDARNCSQVLFIRYVLI